MAYDLPPPAAPPYSTSVSGAAKKSVCGPSLGEKITLFSSTSLRTCVGKLAILSVVITLPSVDFSLLSSLANVDLDVFKDFLK